MRCTSKYIITGISDVIRKYRPQTKNLAGIFCHNKKMPDSVARLRRAPARRCRLGGHSKRCIIVSTHFNSAFYGSHPKCTAYLYCPGRNICHPHRVNGGGVGYRPPVPKAYSIRYSALSPLSRHTYYKATL